MHYTDLSSQLYTIDISKHQPKHYSVQSASIWPKLSVSPTQQGKEKFCIENQNQKRHIKSLHSRKLLRK